MYACKLPIITLAATAAALHDCLSCLLHFAAVHAATGAQRSPLNQRHAVTSITAAGVLDAATEKRPASPLRKNLLSIRFFDFCSMPAVPAEPLQAGCKQKDLTMDTA
jgi:hypothetical protein